MPKIIDQVNTTDTFEVWLQRTNEVIDEMGRSVMTTSVNGDNATGSSSISGSFTANNLIATNILRTNIIDTKVGNNSPIEIRGAALFSSTSQLPVTISNVSGPRLRIRNNNIAWQTGLRGAAGSGTDSEYIITVEGVGSPSFRFGSDGVLYANSIVLTSTSNNASGTVRGDRSILTGAGLTGGGNLTDNRTISLTGQALALHGLTTIGIVSRTAAGVFTTRSIAAGSGITIVNGNTVNGNPVIDVDDSVMRTSGDQIVTGAKTFRSSLIAGTSVLSQIHFTSGQINHAQLHTANTTLAINVTSPSNAHWRDIDIYNGRSGVFAKFEGSTGSFNVGGAAGTQIRGNQINAAVKQNAEFNLALNYENDHNQVRNIAIYDGRRGLIGFIGGAGGDFTSHGNITAYGNLRAASDARLKTNVTTITDSLDMVTRMRGVYFERKNEPNRGVRNVGVIAQEIEEVLPEVVSYDDNDYRSVSYGNIVGLLIEAIKELKEKIDKMEHNISLLSDK